MLDLLFVKDIGKQRRRIGIIGDMRELGTMSKVLHEAVARRICDTSDAAILVGPLTAETSRQFLKKIALIILHSRISHRQSQRYWKPSNLKT